MVMWPYSSPFLIDLLSKTLGKKRMTTKKMIMMRFVMTMTVGQNENGHRLLVLLHNMRVVKENIRHFDCYKNVS